MRGGSLTEILDHWTLSSLGFGPRKRSSFWTSHSRVARHNAVTTPSQHRHDEGDETKQNVTVTAPDTDTEAEQRQKELLAETTKLAKQMAKETAAKRNALVSSEAPASNGVLQFFS